MIIIVSIILLLTFYDSKIYILRCHLISVNIVNPKVTWDRPGYLSSIMENPEMKVNMFNKDGYDEGHIVQYINIENCNFIMNNKDKSWKVLNRLYLSDQNNEMI